MLKFLSERSGRKKCVPKVRIKEIGKWRNVGTSGSYSIKGLLGVISLCGPEKQISCGGILRFFQNTYN